jgi:hypothetical protein
MKEVPGTERNGTADLVILALGFLGPETHSIVSSTAASWTGAAT